MASGPRTQATDPEATTSPTGPGTPVQASGPPRISCNFPSRDRQEGEVPEGPTFFKGKKRLNYILRGTDTPRNPSESETRSRNARTRAEDEHG